MRDAMRRDAVLRDTIVRDAVGRGEICNHPVTVVPPLLEKEGSTLSFPSCPRRGAGAAGGVVGVDEQLVIRA